MKIYRLSSHQLVQMAQAKNMNMAPIARQIQVRQSQDLVIDELLSDPVFLQNLHTLLTSAMTQSVRQVHIGKVTEPTSSSGINTRLVNRRMDRLSFLLEIAKQRASIAPLQNTAFKALKSTTFKPLTFSDSISKIRAGQQQTHKPSCIRRLSQP